MPIVLDIVSWVLLTLGGVIGVLAGIGVLRFPDIFTRMHASSMLESLGAFCVLLGLALQAGPSVIAAKLVVLYVFLLLTAATAGHALAKSTFAAGVQPLLRPGPRQPRDTDASAGELEERSFGREADA
jgi:multicomponent Na+:H+ antiporter subunit G